MYNLSPATSNKKELGGTGEGFSFPAEAFAVDGKYIAVRQSAGNCRAHPVLAARMDTVEVAPVTSPEIAPVAGVNGTGAEGGARKTGEA
jgi:hypothetical protein